MTDEAVGTTEGEAEAQETETEVVKTEVTKTDTLQPDEVTRLKSRNAGLDAKVTSLTESAAAAKVAQVAAEQRLADYEAKTVGGDEALRAQLQRETVAKEEALRDAQMARIEAKYPETFSVLGEAAANLSPEKLAEAEARFAGVEAEEDKTATKPIGNNQARTAANPTEETSDDIARRLEQIPVPW